MFDLDLVWHLLLALTQEEVLIEQSRSQRRLIVGVLTKHMPVHLHAAHQEVAVARPKSQALIGAPVSTQTSLTTGKTFSAMDHGDSGSCSGSAPSSSCRLGSNTRPLDPLSQSNRESLSERKYALNVPRPFQFSGISGCSYHSPELRPLTDGFNFRVVWSTGHAAADARLKPRRNTISLTVDSGSQFLMFFHSDQLAAE